jgi:hypothetical protein
MKDSCIIAPVHPPKYDFVKNFVESYNEHFDDGDLYLIFTNDVDRLELEKRFPNLKYKYIIHEGEQIVTPSPATEKKLCGARWIFDNTEFNYVAMIDVDSVFFRNMDYDELFKNYINNKTIYGHTVNKDAGIHKINESGLRFCKTEDYEKIKQLTRDFSVYSWFNDIPVIERKTFNEFCDYINFNENKKNLIQHDFDWLLYANFLLIKDYMTLNVSDFHLGTDRGSLIEYQNSMDAEQFKKEYLKMNPMWIKSQINSVYMKNTFMLVHVDR